MKVKSHSGIAQIGLHTGHEGQLLSFSIQAGIFNSLAWKELEMRSVTHQQKNHTAKAAWRKKFSL
jgi:hypothetical protein